MQDSVPLLVSSLWFVFLRLFLVSSLAVSGCCFLSATKFSEARKHRSLDEVSSQVIATCSRSAGRPTPRRTVSGSRWGEDCATAAADRGGEGLGRQCLDADQLGAGAHDDWSRAGALLRWPGAQKERAG